MKNQFRPALVLASLVGLTLAGSASADICTVGSKNFKLKVTWTGGGTDEKSECMFSCSTYDVKITHSDCYKSSSSGSTWRYTCDIKVSGKNKRPGYTGDVQWVFSQKYNKVELPANKLPDAVVAEAKLACRD